MPKPGPKSAASIEIGPLIRAEPPAPPGDLAPEEAVIWRQLAHVATTAENAIWLKSLCRHIHNADELGRDIAAVRRVAPLDLRELAGLLRLHGKESERIGSLSSQLRLSPQRRMSGTRAEQLARKLGSAPKPWLDWG
jgi:hypothetical protein